MSSYERGGKEGGWASLYDQVESWPLHKYSFSNPVLDVHF